MDHLRSGVRDQLGQHCETPSLLKIQNLAVHDGPRLVISAIWEAEARKLLETMRQRFQRAEIVPHCTSACATEQDSISTTSGGRMRQIWLRLRLS